MPLVKAQRPSQNTPVQNKAAVQLQQTAFFKATHVYEH